MGYFKISILRLNVGVFALAVVSLCHKYDLESHKIKKMCLPCPVCHQKTFDSCVVMLKRLIQVANDSLICPVCRDTFIGLDKFTIHLFSHTNDDSQLKEEQKEEPPIIKTKVKENSASVFHVDKNGVQCDTCGFYFENIKTLEMHKNLVHINPSADSKSGSSKYPCHLCSKSFKMRGSLMVHLRMVHFGIVPSVPKQEKQESENGPPEVGESGELVKSNININNELTAKQWSCDICLKSFTTKYFLKKHKRLHTGEMPYSCNQCGKMFTFQQSYHKHLLYHNDEKPHTCNQCGRTFKELSTLHNHQRIHTGEKPFSCETCGKSFRQRVSYLVHKRIHTGIMPYKCTACDKSFRHKVSQRTHKCTAQPPGIVVRQPCDLVEKLKKNQSVLVNNVPEKEKKYKISNSPKSEKDRMNNSKSPESSLNNTPVENSSFQDEEYLNSFNIYPSSSSQKDFYSYQAENILDQIVEESMKKIQNETVPPAQNIFYSPITDFYSMVSPEHTSDSIPSPSDKLKSLSLSGNDKDFDGNMNENIYNKIDSLNENYSFENETNSRVNSR